MITAAARSRPAALNWTVLKRKYDYWSCTLPVITICRVFEWIIMGYATCSTLRQIFTAPKSWDNALIAVTLSAKHFLCCPAPGSITSPLLPASTGNSVMLTKKSTSRPIFKWVWNLCRATSDARSETQPRLCWCTGSSGSRTSFLRQMKPCHAAHVTPAGPARPHKQILGDHCSIAIVPWPLSAEYRE